MNDRFTKCWIALEALINLDGKRTHIADRIEEALIDLYERKDPSKKYKLRSGCEIGAIKKVRVNEFHYAIDNPEKAIQTERLLEDLIRSELGLAHGGYARSYLETVP